MADKPIDKERRELTLLERMLLRKTLESIMHSLNLGHVKCPGCEAEVSIPFDHRAIANAISFLKNNNVNVYGSIFKDEDPVELKEKKLRDFFEQAGVPTDGNVEGLMNG